MTTKHIISTIAGLLGFGGIAASAFAESRKNIPTTNPNPLDPDSLVTLSSYVMKNGTCYRVDLLATGGSRSTVVNASLCESTPDL